jgi:hypothetical protein
VGKEEKNKYTALICLKQGTMPHARGTAEMFEEVLKYPMTP